MSARTPSTASYCSHRTREDSRDPRMRIFAKRSREDGLYHHLWSKQRNRSLFISGYHRWSQGGHIEVYQGFHPALRTKRPDHGHYFLHCACHIRATFLFSYLLSRNITIPLVKLTRASTEVKNGNLDVRIRFRRRDEIGKLALNFNDMIDRIGSQISTIERDRDRLKELNEQEKRF